MAGACFLPSTLMDWRRYWNIVIYRTYAELKSEVQLNYMGYVWWLLEPLLNTVLFYVILVTILEQQTRGEVSFLLVGAITWQWLNSSLLTASSSIFDAGGMLKQIYLPKVVLPLIAILTSTWKFLFIFLLLLVWVWCCGYRPTVAYLALPLILLLELAVILAFSLPLAALIPYFPDARVAVDAILRSLMLISGVWFSVEKLSPAYHFYFYLNPMAVLIEAYRAVLLYGQWPHWDLLGYVAIFSACGLALTAWLYARVDRSLVKAIHR
jgi:lipopolysaccharide transport system permease protein